jgi:hypothetical protein
MYIYRESGLHLICVIPDPLDVRKVEICSYDGENKETILLNVPAARMLSDEVDRADMAPFVEGRSFFVEIEV